MSASTISYIIILVGTMIFTLPIWKLAEMLLNKYTDINIRLVRVQILIDIPSIIFGYYIFYFILLIYAKYL